MTDFASSVLYPQTGLGRFYYCVGYLFSFASTVLVVGSVIGMFQRPPPRVYLRVMEGFAIALALTSAIVLFAYVSEIWTALHAVNRFERETFLILRWTGVYAGIYQASVAMTFLPQLFWWKKVRRSLAAILVVASVASLGLWFERLVIAITSYSQDFLPSSLYP